MASTLAVLYCAPMANPPRSLTITVSPELADRLHPVADQLSRILALGVREYTAASLINFPAAVEILEFLARLPAPDEVLMLRPSDKLQAEVAALLRKKLTVELSLAEEQRWQQYAFLEHLVRVAKASALLKLQSSRL